MATDRSTNPKPRIHGRDHLPGGIDPIPAVAASGVPNIATYYRSANIGDAGLTVVKEATTSVTAIPWLHWSLPSDGSFSAPLTAFPNIIPINANGFAIEFLYTQWDAPDFDKAAVLGTDSRIIEADQFALGTAGLGVATTKRNYGDSTSFIRPNAHLNGDTIGAYATNGDTVSHSIVAAYLVIYFWPVPSYTSGDIPGWPA